MKLNLEDISIRSELIPGDIGFVIHLHGAIYAQEYGYGTDFESYVAKGLLEFYSKYDAAKDRVWICEHKGIMIGFLLLMHSGNQGAQLRYFVLRPLYRGIGLGQKLISLLMEFLRVSDYSYCFLYTLPELKNAIALYEKNGFEFTEENLSMELGKPVLLKQYVIKLNHKVASLFNN